MAKRPFYSLEEVCGKLGKTEDDVKALVREGTLREFRDAGKVFFKAEDIDKLAGPPAGEVELEPGELELDAGDAKAGSADLPTLVESSGGTSIIGLEPLDDEGTSGGSGSHKKEDTVITASGIGVFDDDELEIDADPMAKTQITTGQTEADQITLEGAGSGSGLLDLAREADDTALGADLLDEIYPGEEEAAPVASGRSAAPAAAPAPEAAEEEEEEAAEPLAEADTGETIMPVYVATGDPTEGLMGGLLFGSVLVMALGASVMAGVAMGLMPSYAKFLSDGTNFYMYLLGGCAGVMIIALLIGWFSGKAFVPRRR